MIYAIAGVVALIAYLIGSINTSIVLTKSIYGTDIRDSGSGNAGATNMLRTHGAGMAIATLICDILKGAVVVLLTEWIGIILVSVLRKPTSDIIYLLENMHYIAGLFVVFGHDFPIWFGFRGGKGVATSLGVILALNWKIGVLVLIAALLVMIFSRYVSLGSIMAAVIYPFILFTSVIFNNDTTMMKNIYNNAPQLIMAVLLAITLILKHHANIKRLQNGTENKLFSKKKKKKKNEDFDEEYDEEYDEDEESEDYDEDYKAEDDE